MSLSKQDILGVPRLHDLIQEQSRALVSMFESDSRLSASFATQQRWLMSHIGFALYFRKEPGETVNGFRLSSFLEAVQTHRIASRNTADAFVKEMINYKYAVVEDDPNDKRFRPIVPSEKVIAALGGWLYIHLATLDGLDGGARLETMRTDPTFLGRVQPIIADGLVRAKEVRHPETTFSLFTWLDNGGLVMDWLISSMTPASLDEPRVSVGAISVVEMAARLNLSRTHLSRKLREAEELGSIGWEGRRGHSVMWVSRGFRQEYVGAQADKLAIIDNAYTAVAAS